MLQHHHDLELITPKRPTADTRGRRTHAQGNNSWHLEKEGDTLNTSGSGRWRYVPIRVARSNVLAIPDAYPPNFSKRAC